MVYECRFCSKLYKRESAFVKHICKERERHYDLTDAQGQTAFSLYKRWILLRHNRNDITLETFKISRFYKAFYKFANYYRKINGFADLDGFLKLMIIKDLQPSNWLDNKVIAYYLNVMDNHTPVEKIKNSINSIFKLCDAYDCDTSKFFEYIEFDIMITFIKVHKISPWILLNSKHFFKWLEGLSDEEQLIIDAIIDSDKWFEVFNNDSKSVQFAKTCVEELQL